MFSFTNLSGKIRKLWLRGIDINTINASEGAFLTWRKFLTHTRTHTHSHTTHTHTLSHSCSAVLCMQKINYFEKDHLKFCSCSHREIAFSLVSRVKVHDAWHSPSLPVCAGCCCLIHWRKVVLRLCVCLFTSLVNGKRKERKINHNFQLFAPFILVFQFWETVIIRRP